MRIVILASNEQKQELISKSYSPNVALEYITEWQDLSNFKTADALFILREDVDIQQLQCITQPLFLHSVISTLADLNMPSTVSRMNAWPSFLLRECWEIATKDEGLVENIFNTIGWKYILVPDEPGLIAARIVTMIINEAYFTYEQRISTKEEIDLAMKLGTNHPYGPFEWAQIIGLHNIYHLLKALQKKDQRYAVALTLENDVRPL